jgi:hypothetical protein
VPEWELRVSPRGKDAQDLQQNTKKETMDAVLPGYPIRMMVFPSLMTKCLQSLSLRDP